MKTENTKRTRQLLFVSLGILLFLITLSIGNIANAQPPGGGGQGPQIPGSKQIKKMVAEVSKELSLSEEQESKVSKMYVAHFDEVKELTSSGRPDRSKMEALKSEFEKDVKSILTKEQQKKYTAYLKKNQRQMGGQRPSK